MKRILKHILLLMSIMSAISVVCLAKDTYTHISQEEASKMMELDDGHIIVDGEYKEENVEMMAWKTVKGSYPDTEHVKFQTLPEVTVASCTYQGSYTQITEVYAAVIAWMESNGYKPAAPMFNIYHVSPHEPQNPDDFVTEICYPVKKK